MPVGMAWACGALALAILVFLCLNLLRFHLSLNFRSPSALEGVIAVSFLGLRREFHFDRPEAPRVGDRNASGPPEGRSARPAAAAAGTASMQGQQGAVRLPETWLARIRIFKSRLRAAGIKWVLDVKVWGILLRFTLGLGKRILGLLHPKLEFLHIAIQDVPTMSRIATVWSVLSGAIPALACPVEYRFASPTFGIRAKLGGRFSAWNAVCFGCATLIAFPWVPLASRYLASWREPGLNGWQRRVLLP